MKSSRVCIVPARGGSKGLTGKNLENINGVTLVARALLKAVSCGLFDQVILSSDSDEILAEGQLCGVLCHHRSAETASDEATSEAVIEEVLASYSINVGLFAMIQCTTPLLTAEDICAATKLVNESEICTVVSGYTASLHHWLLHPNHSLTPIDKSGCIRAPRQSMQNRIFIENGGIYITDTAAFRKSGNRFNGRVIPYIMNEVDSIDIDNYADLVKARERSDD